MSPASFAAYIRLKTKTNTGTFTDANILLLANIIKDDMARRIVKVDQDYFGVPQTANLVANQREYPFPTDQLEHIKYLEAQLDGTTWLALKEFDLTSYRRTTDEATIISMFSNTQDNAFFDIYRNSIWIYSGTIINVTSGLKLWGYEWPADISDLTLTSDMSLDPGNTQAGMPRSFHLLWADMVVRSFKESSDKPYQLTEGEKNVEARMTTALNDLVEIDFSTEIVGKLPDSKGKLEGNNGYNF